MKLQMSEKKTKECLKCFFSSDIPDTMYPQLVQPINELAQRLCNDMREKFSEEGIELDSSLIEFGLMKALHYMSLENVEYPSKILPSVYIKAFGRAASSLRLKIAEKKQRIINEKIQDEVIEETAKRNKVASEILTCYSELKKEAHQQDINNPSVWAYKELLQDKRLDLSGYAYFFISYRLPSDEGIYNHPDVIAAHNNHPVLHKRGQVNMMINGERANSLF